MEENAAIELGNETLDGIGYLLDKLNVQMEVSSEAVLDAVKQFVGRVITWEILTSVIQIIVTLLIIIVVSRLLFSSKRFKKLKDKIRIYINDNHSYNVNNVCSRSYKTQ